MLSGSSRFASPDIGTAIIRPVQPSLFQPPLPTAYQSLNQPWFRYPPLPVCGQPSPDSAVNRGGGGFAGAVTVGAGRCGGTGADATGDPAAGADGVVDPVQSSG